MRFVVKYGASEASARAVTGGIRHHILEVPDLETAISLAKANFVLVGRHTADDLRGFLIEDESGANLRPWEEMIVNN